MELNREEIINALEHCKDRACVEGCPRLCNNIPMEDDCRLSLIHDAIALIKELTEENSALQMRIDDLEIELEQITDY